MATKNKTPRKRNRKCLEINDKDQDPPLIIANIKRRRKTRDRIKSVNKNKIGNVELLGNCVAKTNVCKTATSVVTLCRHSSSNSCWENSTNTGSVFNVPSAKKEYNFKNNVRKTYASGNRQMHLKTDKERLKRSSKPKSSLPDISGNKDRFINEIEENKIKEEDLSKSSENNNMKDSVFSLEGYSHKVQVGIPARDDAVIKGDSIHDKTQSSDMFKSQVVDEWKCENNCTVHVTCDCSQESKTFIENNAKKISKTSVSENLKVNDSEMTKESYSVLSSISSSIPLPCGYHSLPTTIQPVSSSGVPVPPVMPTLNANTSAIAAITTPITCPVLPEMTRDSFSEVGAPHSNTNPEAHSFGVVSSASSFACSSHNMLHHVSSSPTYSMIAVDRNHLHESTLNCNATCTENHRSTQLEHHVAEKDISSIPLVHIDDDSDSLSTEKDNFPVSVVSCSPDAFMSEWGTISDCPVTPSNRQDHTFSTPLRVDNWATYLLHRLQLLYEHQQECDLMMKFSCGETLKVHRAIVSACTSLMLDPHPVHREEELMMPSDLSYASVEPVIRFVYSGHLDVRGSRKEMRAIYAAAQKLQVPLLTRLMDRRFPFLSPSHRIKTRLPVWKRSEKLLQQNKQHAGKGSGNILSSRALFPSTTPLTSHQLSALSGESSSADLTKSGESVETKDAAEDTSLTVEENEEEGEEDEGQLGSVYLLLTNSQKIAQANAAVRRKKPTEEARPTRFELEEDAENAPVRSATWSSKNSSLSPFFVATSAHSEDGITSCSSSYSSTESMSLSPLDVSLFTSSRSPLCTSRYNLSLNSSSGTVSLMTSNHNSSSQDPFSLLTQVVSEEQSADSKIEEGTINRIQDSTFSTTTTTTLKSFKEQRMAIDDHDNIGDDDIEKDGEELMEKISSICKQLEERDADENEPNGKEVYVSCDYKMEMMDCEIPSTNNHSQVSPFTEGENSSDSRDSFVLSNTSVPVKSILKKKKDKNNTNKFKKRVSFPLDENNELINEVATYSHAKEPAQSLIEVQKTVGSFKSSSSSSSPVKLTLSLKNKVLVNLSLDDCEAKVSESPCQENERGKKKKDDIFSSQSANQGQVNKGDMSNHAKIISEVLKKYPHLVKDKKNIRLKILKKGSDKGGGGKLVKSKVQYLVLSDNDSKTKTSTKLSKTTLSSVSKMESNTLPRSTHSAQTFECPECEDTVFLTYFTFKKHVLAEHKDKSSTILSSIENVPYACYTCFLNEPLEFSDYCSYQQHMKDVHSKSETRLCSICGFRPGRKLELAYHQYTEHNKIPRNVTFPKCDLCDHVAMNDAALLKHRSQHTNADNYTCSVCGVEFCSFGALQGHMQTKLCQNKPSISHKCPHCPLTFARSYNLKAHCKSSHRAIQTTVQIAPGSAGEQIISCKHEAKPIELSEAHKVTETNLSSNIEQGKLNVEGMCEALTSMNSQSSSEAEALSTVANSLAASLGLPEETVNHYMYNQGGKLEFPGSLDDEKYDDSINRPGGVNVHLVDTTASVSGYQGELSLCHDRTYTSQAPMPSTTNVGTLYSVGVVSSHIVSNHLLPGQILPSQMLQGEGCVSTAGGSVLGAPSHSWTYVTYQVPATTEDIPTVITEAAALNNTSITQHQGTSVMTPNEGTTAMVSEQDIRVESATRGSSSNNSNGTESECEPENPLVVMANTAAQADISHSSNLSAAHAYDAFSTQFE